MSAATYLGSACKRGHPGLRYAASRACVQCQLEHAGQQTREARHAAPRRDYGTGGLTPRTSLSRNTGLDLMRLVAGVRVELRP